MAAFLIFLLVFALRVVEAQQRYTNISLGSFLNPGTNESWLSPSGLYAFGFFRQANGFSVGIFLAGIPEKTVVWTANTDDNPTVPGNVTLLFTADGRLVLRPSQGQDIDVATHDESIASAAMLDTGNFVLYNSNQKIIWQSFDRPTDTLLQGQRLSANQELLSRVSDTDYSRGIFGLYMQNDGNLVQYPVGGIASSNAYYSTGTWEYGDHVTLNLDDDGHLYLLNATTNIKNLTEGGYPKNRTIYLMRLDFDGIFRVYSHSLDKGNWSKIWSSTNNKCDPRGLCGLNGFCVQMDEDVDCRCLTGFVRVNPEKWTSGCERNFTAESCQAKNATSRFVVRRSENTVWEDTSPYSTLDKITMEDCEAACMEDCNCEVAFFKDQQCKKQRLPLRYGRRSSGDSNVALIKVGISASITNGVSIDASKETKKELRVDVLIISISLAVFAFLALVLSVIVVRRTRSWAYKMVNEIKNVELVDNVGPHAFTYEELLRATNNFKDELGKGAFGTVYKGILPAIKKVIAVKRLDKVLAEGEIEFQNEMKVIGKTHHRNLVKLLGYCIDGTKRLLVYEFMSNGSLADILFTQEKLLSLEERIKIALGIARGILYLHEECEKQIIHCDIKPQNILMDDNMCAKISDFGLAKLLKQDQTRTYTGIRGTKGYVAPEWHRKLPVTVKVDVYSFGIVLFEVICCRKSVDWSLPEDIALLDEWVYACFETGQLGKLVPDEEVDMIKLERLIKVGIWCIQDEPSLRPSMKKVLLMLEGTVDIPVPPSPASFLSAV